VVAQDCLVAFHSDVGVLKKNEKNVAQFCEKYDSAVAAVATNRVNETDFEEIKILGRGGFGVVKLVKHVVTGETFALKCMSKCKMVKEAAREGIDFNWVGGPLPPPPPSPPPRPFLCQRMREERLHYCWAEHTVQHRHYPPRPAQNTHHRSVDDSLS
jgi:serine/threonine protein kinase